MRSQGSRRGVVQRATIVHADFMYLQHWPSNILAYQVSRDGRYRGRRIAIEHKQVRQVSDVDAHVLDVDGALRG